MRFYFDRSPTEPHDRCVAQHVHEWEQSKTNAISDVSDGFRLMLPAEIVPSEEQRHPMQIHAIYFHVESVNEPDRGDMFLVVWPEESRLQRSSIAH